MMRKNVEHHQAIFHPAPRRNLVTQHDFLAVVMRARIEEKLAGVFAQHVGARSVASSPESQLRRRAARRWSNR